MQSLAAFFELESSAQLQWAHGVNTLERLHAACADSHLHVLEADVYYGDDDATPQLKTSATCAEGVDLASFLMAAATAGKAVKLDFHAPAAVEPTLATLRLLKIATPVMFHADVFTLLSPRNRSESLEPEQFLRLVATTLPTAIVSLGWSLKRPHDADGRVEDALILQMASMLAERLGPCSYGLEIRAGYAPTRNGVRGEHGAALIFDPLPPPLPAQSHTNFGDNVVSLMPHLRRVA